MNAISAIYLPESKQLAENVQSRLLMTKSPESVDKAYQVYATEHYLQGLSCKPMSRATFYRLWQKVPDELKILKRKGKRAAREYTRARLGRVHKQGFMASCQCDALHEPIKLLSSFNFLPLEKGPVHHFVIESETTVLMGLASNYHTGSERTEYSIDSVKSAFLPKTKTQETWGSTHAWPIYGKTFEITLDAGQGYNNGDFDGFLGLCYTSAKVTRSRQPQEKALVESFNKTVKFQFTRPLKGSYDDKLPAIEHEKIIPWYTELEHTVLLHRFAIDTYNQSTNKGQHISRTAHWLQEARRQPPVLPANPQNIVNYLGVEDRKTIMEKVGIQITVLGVEYIYNSTKLQSIGRKIRKQISDKAKRRVFLKFSISQPDFIMVRHPHTNEAFRVDRIVDDQDTRMSERLAKYGLPLNFYETQNLDVLAKMSNAEIHAHASQRRALIDEVIKSRHINNAPQAIALETAAERDRERFMSAVQGAHFTEEHQNSSTEAESDFSGFSTNHADDIDWNSAF
jgi:hypothetical protein